MKSILLLATIFVVMALNVFAQKNCSNDSTGLIPLIDLSGKSWRGFIGGLYPDGTNLRPSAHKTKALLQAQNIKLLDANGAISSSGKIVWIGVGASNPRTEFMRFSNQMDTFGLKNPALKLINTCIGGQGIQKMNSQDDNYWKQAEKQLSDSGLTNKQVQIAWIETDNTQTGDTTFPQAPQMLIQDFKTLLISMKQLYPNLKLCYITARAYSGYADASAGATAGKGLLYPRDYLNGWAIKWLIESQINGESGFEFEGASASIPFITWGTYNWADGSVKRSDGLQWLCDSDIGEDGLHLSTAGEIKSGALMFDYFTKDETTQAWITGQVSTDVNMDNFSSDDEISIMPNPTSNELTIRGVKGNRAVNISNILGQVVWSGEVGNEIKIDTHAWAVGIYLIRIGENGLVVHVSR
ncbi:MAG: T9SS type A sorting domain-containing protein [Ignavibacteriae bacterium]|nr:T9SS type A sorting domain-containing protein [Ignavibacteriota bacterium]